MKITLQYTLAVATALGILTWMSLSFDSSPRAEESLTVVSALTDDIETPIDLPHPKRKAIAREVEQLVKPDLTFQGVAYYLPVVKNFSEWLLTVGYPEDTIKSAWQEPGVESAWAILQEKRELQAFIIGYKFREQNRWHQMQASIPLFLELSEQRLEWLENYCTSDQHIYDLIRDYSEHTINQIWESGILAPDLADSDARWSLFRALSALPIIELSSSVITSALEKHLPKNEHD